MDERPAPSGAPVPLDLELDGIEGAVSTWLLPGGEPTLVDPGPSTTLETLRARLDGAGLAVEDLRHLLLTHVHLDHAGATGHLVRENPRLFVHVHEDGAPHLADPERLVASTRRTFGEAHDRLWGAVLPVPAERIRPLEGLGAPGVPGAHGVTGGPGAAGRAYRGRGRGSDAPGGGVRPLATPGHIGHHVSFLHEPSGTLLAGDATGILLHPDAPVHPPTPPPGVEVVAWVRTLEGLAGLGVDRFGVAHFGMHRGLPVRAAELAERLRELKARVEASLEGADEASEGSDASAGADPPAPAGAPAEAYEEEVRRRQSDHLPREWVDRYFDAFAAATDWVGMVHHVERIGPGRRHAAPDAARDPGR